MSNTLQGIFTFFYDQITERSDRRQLEKEASAAVEMCLMTQLDDEPCPDFFEAYLSQRRIVDQSRQTSPLWRHRPGKE